jgi:hypothetical protein
MMRLTPDPPVGCVIRPVHRNQEDPDGGNHFCVPRSGNPPRRASDWEAANEIHRGDRQDTASAIFLCAVL